MAYINVKSLSLKTPMGKVYTDVSMSFDKGSVIAVYGSEKTGRTSLLLTLSGRMKPSKGEFYFDSLALSKKSGKIRAASALSFFEGINDVQSFLTVKKLLSAELQLSGKSGSKRAVKEYLQRWNFTDLADVKYVNLDSFDKAVFGFMLAATGNPALICVDDIETNMTQHQSGKLIKLFKKYAQETGCCILFAISAYEVASYSDGVVVMSQDAEAQRQAVLKQHPEFLIPVVGSGNGSNVEIGDKSNDDKAKESKGLK